MPKGHFELMVMFFGLCNSLVTFQAYMNNAFGDSISTGWLLVYMDNVFLAS